MPERRYDEKEMAELLRLAAELQGEGPLGTPSKVGLTLSEIERLAAEVGLDPSNISLAASRLDALSPRKRKFHFWGAPTRDSWEQSAPGAIGDAEWEEAVAEARRHFGGPGKIGAIGASREWTGGTDYSSATLSVIQRDDRVKVRANLDQEGGFALLWTIAAVCALLGSLIAWPIVGKHATGAFLPSLILYNSVVYGLTWRAVQRMSRRNEAKVTALLNAVTDIAQQTKSNPRLPETVDDQEHPTIREQT
jgi:hypothetical protein